MYQFTREFIINDNEGKLTGAKRFIAEDHILKVDHMINIKADDVCSAYKSVGVAASNETIDIDLSSLTVEKDKLYRLALVLGQEGRVISTYNDQYPEHSRSFLYEAVAKNTTGASLAESFASAIKKEIALFESSFFTVEETSGVITLSAPDCYTRFNKVCLAKVPTDRDDMVGAVLTGYLDYDVVLEADRKALLDGTVTELTLTEGNVGKNTTNFIIHNMRLLTAANINPYGVNMDERPLPKSVYDQYTFELVTERRNTGHQVMGAVDHSLVTVIFFVLHSLASEFETALTAAGITPEVVAQPQPVKKVIATTKYADAAAEDAAAAITVPTKATLPAESVDGTNPTADVELALS